ncbi:MAG: hypothetical protein AB8F78_20145 [Saprospiraceae bacterium]
MMKPLLFTLALSLVFQASILAQFSLIDTVTSTHPLNNIDGKDGFSFYSNVDRDTYEVTAVQNV